MTDKESTSVTPTRCEEMRGKVYGRMWWIAGVILSIPLMLFLICATTFVSRELFDERMSHMQEKVCEVKEKTDLIPDMCYQLKAIQDELTRARKSEPSVFKTGAHYVDRPQRKESP